MPSLQKEAYWENCPESTTHWVGLTTLSVKLLYLEACELKIPWEIQVPDGLIKEVSKWEEGLPTGITVHRPLTAHRQNITKIDLHCFGDESGRRVSAALYAVVIQPSGVSVGLVTAKARLAKQGLSIPRLELVSGHMGTDLITNTRDALEGFPVAVNFTVGLAAQWLFIG